jgi:hypothetical protein
MATLAPRKGVFVSRYFARRQTVRWRCVEVSPGDVPAARRGPRMRQDRRSGGASRQRRASSLRKRNAGRKGTASRESQARERKPCSILLRPRVKPPRLSTPAALGTPHPRLHGVWLFACERENVAQEGFDALTYRVSPPYPVPRDH